MILKRREKAPFWERVRQFIAPRKGVLRGVDYLSKRMRRLPDSPHRIALGFACGAMASFTPFFGFHFFVAAGIAWLARGNIISALFGTAVGNPLTFPLISTTSLWLGTKIMGSGHDGSTFDGIMHAFGEGFSAIWGTVKHWFGYGPTMFDGLVVFFHEVFLPYLVGGIVPGIISGVVFYLLLLPIVTAYQKRRRDRLAATRLERTGPRLEEVAGE